MARTLHLLLAALALLVATLAPAGLAQAPPDPEPVLDAVSGVADPVIDEAFSAVDTALGTADTLVGIGSGLANGAAHHAHFTFDPPLKAGASTVQGKSVPDPRVEVVGFHRGAVVVNASLVDGSGAVVPFAPGKQPAARLVVSADGGGKAVAFIGNVRGDLRDVATFRIPYVLLANATANQTAWQMVVQAPNVPDSLQLSSPYAAAPYNGLANGADAPLDLVDLIGPTTLVVPTDHVPPALKLLTDLAGDPFVTGVAHPVRANATDGLGVASVKLTYAFQDTLGRVRTYQAVMKASNDTYAASVTVPAKVARVFYGLLATDFAGNQAFTSGSVDLPLPAGVPRPAPPASNPVPPPAPRPAPTPHAPAAGTSSASGSAQGAATAPDTLGTVPGPGAALVPAGAGRATEPGIGIAVAAALFGLPFLILALARL
jgi:hypothetical protein